MRIQAFGEEFEVIHGKGMETEYAVLQCKEVQGKMDYTFLCFSGERQVKDILPYFSELAETKEYRDYRGCFAEDGKLYVAFYKKNGTTLANQLERGVLSLESRILVGRRILEKFLLWMLPCFMVGQLLDLDRILVSGEEIAFDYAWRAPVELDDSMTATDRKMARFFEALFENELAYEPIDFLRFLERLKQGRVKDLFQIYEEYDQVCGTLFLAMEKPSVLERLKERLLELAGKSEELVKILALFIGYLAVIIALIYGIQSQKEEKKEEQEQGVIFEKIGNLDLQKEEQR